MNNPKVSIITPTYNSSLFIKRTIQSVLNQTFTDWEYLIIDDHSNDNTIELVEEFIKKDSRIKLLKTPQNSGGPATPKNVGIENAKGEYIAFLDHDDQWLPEKLEKQLKIFEGSKDEKLGLVSCFVNVKDNFTNKIICKYNTFFRGNTIKEITKGCFIYTSSCVLINKSVLLEVDLFDNQFKTSDDWDMWLRISKAGYKFDFVPEYLLNYFVHNKNSGYENKSSSAKMEFIYIFKKHQDLFLKYNYLIVGYCYFILKKYRLSRKHFIKLILSKNSNCREKIKSMGYIILSFSPSLEIIAKKIWKKIQ